MPVLPVARAGPYPVGSPTAQAAARASARRDAETLPVGCGRGTDELVEEFAESGRIGIADIPGNPVHRLKRAFQTFARPGDTNLLKIGVGPVPGGSGEPAQEGPLCHPGHGMQVGLMERLGKPRVKMVLGPADGGIAMVEARDKGGERPLAGARRIDKQEARRGKHGRSTQVSLHKGQAKIGPGQDAASGNNIAVVQNHLVFGEPDVRETPGELFGEGPVGCGAAAVQQAGLGQYEGTGAHRPQHGAL